ncbi:MAG: DUF4172 domain-containing protein [Rhodoferax sp.]|nr:DUF4172 domain-containing protein [Rhodoferax sp.]
MPTPNPPSSPRFIWQHSAWPQLTFDAAALAAALDQARLEQGARRAGQSRCRADLTGQPLAVGTVSGGHVGHHAYCCGARARPRRCHADRQRASGARSGALRGAAVCAGGAHGPIWRGLKAPDPPARAPQAQQ